MISRMSRDAHASARTLDRALACRDAHARVRAMTSLRVHPVVLGAALVVSASCVPKRDLPPDEIQRLSRLDHVMHVQATIADPQFKKIGRRTYADEDWAAFSDVGRRLQVTSTKIKEFSKGPGFDTLADRLHANAEELAAAAEAKDAALASDALSKIKLTCKTCHSEFR
jgi:hypothetical protein